MRRSLTRAPSRWQSGDAVTGCPTVVVSTLVPPEGREDVRHSRGVTPHRLAMLGWMVGGGRSLSLPRSLLLPQSRSSLPDTTADISSSSWRVACSLAAAARNFSSNHSDLRLILLIGGSSAYFSLTSIVGSWGRTSRGKEGKEEEREGGGDVSLLGTQITTAYLDSYVIILGERKREGKDCAHRRS